MENIFKLAKIENCLPKLDVLCDDGSLRRPILSLKKCDGLGLDGALKSKNLQIDQRIKSKNPSCISIHCACHSGQLCLTRLHTQASKDSQPLTDRQLTMMNLSGQSVQTWINLGTEVSKKLHDITVASCQVDQLFKDSQRETGENTNFKSNKPVQIGGRPMFRWESSLFFCKRIVKLLESIVKLMEKMIELKLCNDPKHPIMYSVNYVISKVKGADFWSNVGWQIDTLTPLVKFIVSNELSETDPESLMFSRDTCLRETRKLITDKENPGSKEYQKLMRTIKGKVWKGCGENWNQGRMSVLYCRATEMLLENFKELFNKETEDALDMFSFLSLNSLRRECKTVDHIDTFKTNQLDRMVEFFCEDKLYIPTFSETDPTKTHGAPAVSAPPLVEDEADLRAGLAQLLQYIFLNFLGVNKATSKFWTLTEALKEISCSNLPWFSPDSGVRRVITFYRNLVPTSAELERLMSYFRLLDTPLTQARTPKTVSKMLMLLKDAPSPNIFYFDLATTIWKYLTAASHTGDPERQGVPGRRFIYFPDPSILPTPGKLTVKPFKDILELRVERKKKKAELRKKLSQQGSGDEQGLVTQDATTALAAVMRDIESLDDIEEDLVQFDFGDRNNIVVDQIFEIQDDT